MITPQEARRRLAGGSAILVDIRERMEHAREAIPGARSQPLSTFDPAALRGAPAVIFHCQSGKRTCENAGRLLGCGAAETYLLEGGLSGWKQAGYPTNLDRSQPIELQRQVQIAAGALIIAGLILSWLASPLFLAVPAFVGTGLVFAGVSGWCGMARLLGLMPWNRTAG
jgi:rhodanese-related sulfurtransferase